MLPQIQTGEKRKLQNLLENASLFLSSEAQPWHRDEWLALAHSVAWDGEGTARRPDGLDQGDASEGNCQPLLLMGIGVAAGGATEGARLQKRLGMRFLSLFPCFHGNSSKQEQPALNFAAYRSGTPCPVLSADFGSRGFQTHPHVMDPMPPRRAHRCVCTTAEQGKEAQAQSCQDFRSSTLCYHMHTNRQLQIICVCIRISAFYSARDSWRK